VSAVRVRPGGRRVGVRVRDGPAKRRGHQLPLPTPSEPHQARPPTTLRPPAPHAPLTINNTPGRQYDCHRNHQACRRPRRRAEEYAGPRILRIQVIETDGTAEATREEMSAAKLPLPYRDSCAHLLIPLNRCRYEEYYLPWKCEVRENG